MQRIKVTDDTCEVVLVFGRKALDSRHGIDPDPEEGEESDRTVDFG